MTIESVAEFYWDTTLGHVMRDAGRAIGPDEGREEGREEGRGAGREE